jgi:DNA repair exonuclease SbcCD nuclease subunit
VYCKTGLMTAHKAHIRFIHSSDWQLGMTRAFLSDEASARFSQDRINAISRLGKLATEHDAKFIIVAGDVFESNQLSRQTLIRALDALESLPVPVFLLPGNHDPLDGSSIFLTKEFQNAGKHIFVLRDMTPVEVPNCPGVEVVGAPWRTKHPSSDLCRDLADALGPANGVTRIAVAHGQVDTLSPDLSRPDIIDLARAEQAIEEERFHYLGLGDRHSVTEVGSTARIWYSGAPVATAFDEVDANKALLVELGTETPCRVEPLDVGAWSFIAEERSMNGTDDLADLDKWLGELPNKECTAVKVGFEGSINLATAAELDELMDTKAELFASLRRRERTTNLAVVPDELDQDSVSLSGYARDTWDELLMMSRQGNPVAQDALRLMYRLSAQSDAD